MAKKQTRRSISVSRVTYERLKAFCESNGISMSQFVETRVGDFLGEGEEGAAPAPTAPQLGAVRSFASDRPFGDRPFGERPSDRAPAPVAPRPALTTMAPRPVAQVPSAPRTAVPLTSAAARFAIEPPPPIIKPRADQPAPPVAPRTADQIFTF
jgi:hypothetical protein